MVNFEQVNVGWEVSREMSAVTSQMDIFSFSFFFFRHTAKNQHESKFNLAIIFINENLTKT